MSRILVWSPNYAPEVTGIPPLVTNACEWLAGRGHEVEVVTAMPSYPDRVISEAYRGRLWCTETRGPVKVRRSWLRVRPDERFHDKALYEASFAALSLPSAVRRLRWADVVLCLVPSLAATVAGTALARATGTRSVVWLQDLVLRAAESLDGLPERARSALALAGRMEALALRSADHVVVCNPAFASYAIERGVAPDRVETIFNWADLGRITPEPAKTNGRTLFLYSGNLGYTQGLETLVEAGRRAGDKVAVEIVGRGNSERRVRDLASDTPNVRVFDPVTDRDYPQLLGRADALVVVQRAVSADANFPSKIASYFASGRPVVASIAPHSVAARVLADSGGAVLVPPEDPGELAAAMRRLQREPNLRSELGMRARRYAERHFGREEALTRLERALVGPEAA